MIRTCIATRTQHGDGELLRLVYRDGKILADPRRRLTGRGAWITPTIEALEMAEARHAFARAFRVKGAVDTGHVRNHLAEIADGPENIRKTEH